MSEAPSDAMDAASLFSILSDVAWSRDELSIPLSDVESEYLLKFCEINRNTLIRRIEKERVGVPTPLIIYRICRLLFGKWHKDNDYRFLNVLYKFEARHYVDKLPNDAVSDTLRIELQQTLRRELSYD